MGIHAVVSSNAHLHLDRWIWLIINHLKVLKLKVIYVSDLPVDLQLRESPWNSLNLLLESIDMIAVDVRVSHDVNELTRVHIDDHGYHIGEQSVRGDVERNAEPHITGSLVHLTGQLWTAFFRETDVELAEDMARWQSHLFESGRIPSREKDPAVVWVGLECMDDVSNLIIALASVIGVTIDVFGAEMTPLEPINGTQIAFASVGESQRVQILSRTIAVPDMNALFGQLVTVSATRHKPQQFFQDSLEKHPFRRE